MSDTTPFSTHRLGEIADVRFSSVDKKSRADEHPVRLCNYVDVLRNAAIGPGLELMAATASESERARFGLQKGDVVFTKDSESAEEIGLASIVTNDLPDLVLGYHLGFARVSRPDLVDSAYLYRAFQAPSTLRYFSRKATGAVRAALSLGSVKDTPIPLLPIDAQRRIAALFSAADRAIQAADKLVAAKREFKRGLMQDLLTGRRRFPGFEGAWEERRLGELFDNRMEKGRSDLPLLAITGNSGVVLRDSLSRRDTSSADKSGYKKCVAGDIAYNTMRMWQGVSGLVTTDGIVSPAYTVLIPKHSVHPSFMSYLFKLPRLIFDFQRNSQGLTSDTWNLKFPAFSKIKIRIPSCAEQIRIADALSTLDNEITHLKSLGAQLREQKRGLMQRIFSGELDLSAIDTDAAADAAPREVSA